MKVAVVKYNAGNTQSVINLLEKLGCEVIVTDDANKLFNADKVILPGVGEASSAMNYLSEKGLDKVIPQIKSPFLGICLGMQLMGKSSEEGNTDCLNIASFEVKKFPPLDLVPHMGWNSMNFNNHPILEGITEQQDLYFVHSYFAEITDECIASCDYINPFAAAIQKDNFYGMQFHPEKSAKVGETLIKNFLSL